MFSWLVVLSAILKNRPFQLPVRGRYIVSRCFASLDNEIIDSELPDIVTTTNNTVIGGHIYFVATPIGNLNDISKRAVSTLSQVDVICAEDTRHTHRLLNLLKIENKKVISHHEHNYKEQIPHIIHALQTGKSIAVVSDAGTPGISDPGAQLAEACHDNDIPVHPVPGASAVISALSVSGFPASLFTFFGFAPVKGTERAARLSSLAACTHTAALFEAPHRVVRTLQELARDHGQGGRPCVCCRETTKLHEELVRGTVDECASRLSDRQEKDGKVCALPPAINSSLTLFSNCEV